MPDWDVTPPQDMSEIEEVSRPEWMWCPWEFKGSFFDFEGLREQWRECLRTEGRDSPRCHCMGIGVNGPPK